MNLWNKFWFQEGSIKYLAIFRIWISALLFLEFRNRYWSSLSTENFFGNYYAAPFFDWLPQPTYEAYVLLLIGIFTSTILMAIGLFGRLPFISFFVLASYHFLLNELWYSNHLYLMIFVVGVLALSPCMKLYSLDNWIARKLKKPWTRSNDTFSLWTQRMIMVHFSLVFIASAISKITLPDWRSGQVLKAIFEGREAKIFPDFFHTIYTIFFNLLDNVHTIVPGDSFHTLALLVIATQLLVCIGLWFRQVRLIAILSGIVFSGLSELYLYIHLFSYFSLGFLLLFATPGFKDKVIKSFRGIKNRFAADHT